MALEQQEFFENAKQSMKKSEKLFRNNEKSTGM